MLEKIIAIIKDNWGYENYELSEHTSFKDDLDADSLDLLEMLVELEDEYSVEIPVEELQGIDTIGDLINYLKEKGVDE